MLLILVKAAHTKPQSVYTITYLLTRAKTPANI